MIKPSTVFYSLGVLGVAASGFLNAMFLMVSSHSVTIEVPTHNISPYQTIGSNDVTLRKISISSLDSDVVQGNLVGRVAIMTIPKGDQIQSFELSTAGGIAETIQNLYLKYPNYSFAQIQVISNPLSSTLQPNQHVNLFSDGKVYKNVWVLSSSSSSGSISNTINEAVSNLVSASPTPSQQGGTTTLLIGGLWSTVKPLMMASNTQVVIGNTEQKLYSLGSHPVNYDNSTVSASKVAKNITKLKGILTGNGNGKGKGVSNILKSKTKVN